MNVCHMPCGGAGEVVRLVVDACLDGFGKLVACLLVRRVKLELLALLQLVVVKPGMYVSNQSHHIHHPTGL